SELPVPRQPQAQETVRGGGARRVASRRALAVLDPHRELRLLQLARARGEAVEEALVGARHERRDRDVQLLRGQVEARLAPARIGEGEHVGADRGEQLRGPLRERQRLERVDHLAGRAGGQIVRGQQLLRGRRAGGAAGEDQRGRGEGGEQGATRQGGGHEDPSGRRQGRVDRTPAGYASPGTG